MRCIECDEPLDAYAEAHQAHEPGCDMEWCRCDAYAHPGCCRECRPVAPIRGQLAAFPLASTRGLPKKALG